MPHDLSATGEACSLPEATSGRARAGRTRFALWNGTRIGLVLALASLVLWLPTHRWLPATAPTRRAAGTARVPVAGLALAPDGRSLATADGLGHVTLWRAD